MTTHLVLELIDVSVAYGGIQAVHDVSLRVASMASPTQIQMTMKNRRGSARDRPNSPAGGMAGMPS